jgi:hypothetical protein
MKNIQFNVSHVEPTAVLGAQWIFNIARTGHQRKIEETIIKGDGING